jgi:cell division transport system ATP-binding protein
VCEQGSAVVMITHNLHLLDMFPGRVYQCKDHHLTEIVDTGDEADGYEPIDDEEDTIDD